MSKIAKKYRTVYLFATPNFVVGLGVVFSMFGGYFKYTVPSSEIEGDSRAICNDWNMIGLDLQNAMDSFPKK